MIRSTKFKRRLLRNTVILMIAANSQGMADTVWTANTSHSMSITSNWNSGLPSIFSSGLFDDTADSFAPNLISNSMEAIGFIFIGPSLSYQFTLIDADLLLYSPGLSQIGSNSIDFGISSSTFTFNGAGADSGISTLSLGSGAVLNYIDGATATSTSIISDGSNVNFDSGGAISSTIDAQNGSQLNFLNNGFDQASNFTIGTASLSFQNSSSATNGSIDATSSTVTFQDDSTTSGIDVNLFGSTLNAHSSSVLQIGSLIGDSTSTLDLGGSSIELNGNGSSTVFAGTISGNSTSLVKTGAGDLTLSGTNTYVAPLNISGGSVTGNTSSINPNQNISVGSLTNIIFDQNSNGSFNGSISGNGSLQKIGSAILTLTATNSYLGGTTVTSGILKGTTNSLQGTILNNSRVSFAQSFNGNYLGNMSGSGVLEINGTGTVGISGTNSYMGGTDLISGTASISLDALGANASNLNFLGGTLLLNSTSSMSRNFVLSAAGNITTASASNWTISGLIADGTSPGPLVVDGSGLLKLTGLNTYSQGTTLKGGILSISNNANLGTGNIVFQGGTLEITGSGITTSKGITLNGTGTIQQDTGTSIFNGLIQNGMTPGPLVKTGAGALQITNTNTYTQGTVINAGTLQISGNSNLGSGSVEFGDGSLELLSGTGVNFNNAVTLNGSGTVIADTGTSWTFGGVIANGLSPGHLIKQGPGTLALTGVNTYTNGTDILGGILAITDDANLGAAAGSLSINNATLELAGGVGETSTRAVTLVNNATFQVDTGFDWTFTNQIQGAGKLLKTGPGLLTLSGTNIYSLGTEIQDGTLAVSSASNLGTGGLAFNGANSILEVSGTSTFAQPATLSSQAEIATNTGAAWTFSNAISGTGPLIVSGDGLLSLTGTNTYNQGTSVESLATLRIQDNNSVGSGALHLEGGLLQLASGTVNLANAIDIEAGSSVDLLSGADWTFSGVISDGTSPGPLVVSGIGELALTNTNTYSQGTVFEGGTVIISSDDNLGTGNLTFEGGTLEITGSITSNKTITLNADAIIQQDAGTSVLNGLIQDGMTPGSLVKTGIGALEITNTNTYTQGTVIDVGTIQISGNSNLGTGDVELSGGNLELLSGSGINFNNSITLNGQGTVTADTGASWTFNGVIANGLNPGNLIKDGAGTLALAGVNTYTNGTEILGGILAITDDANLGAAAGPLSINNATLELAGGVGETSAREITLTNDAAFQVDSGFDWTFTNQIQGAGKLLKTGPGLLTLSGTNIYSLGTEIQDGTLAVSSASNLGTGGLAFNGANSILEVSGTSTFAQLVTLSSQAEIAMNTGAAWTFSNAISGTGPLIVSGDGLLSLTGNNSYNQGTSVESLATLRIQDNNSVGSGALHLEGGLLQLASGSVNFPNAIDIDTGSSVELLSGADWTFAGVISDGTSPGPLVVDGLGTLTLSNVNTYSQGTTFAGGVVKISNDNNLGTGDLIFEGGTLEITSGVTSNKGITLNGTGTIQQDTGTSVFNGLIQDGLTPGPLVKTGAGNLQITNTNTYTQGTVIDAGTLQISGNSNLGSGSVEFDGGSLELLSGAGINFSNAVTLNGSGTVIADTGTSWTFSGVIANGLNPGNLIKAGNGTLALSGVNAYTNGTSILGGILTITDDANLGAAAGSLSINNATLQLAGGVGETSARPITIIDKGFFQVDSGFDWTFTNQIQGAGKLLKTGPGVLTLSGTNIYSLTEINNGTLAVSSASNLGTSELIFNGANSILEVSGTSTFAQPVTLSSQAEIAMNTGAAWTFSNAISGTGPLIVSGNGVLSLTGTNTYNQGTSVESLATLKIQNGNSVGSGALHLEGGLLQLASGTANLANAIDIDTGSSVDLLSGSNWTFSGVISNGTSPGPLVVSGSGELALTNTNTYSQGTVFEGGTVIISNDNNLGTGGLTFDGGTLEITGSITSNKTITLNANAVIQQDAGTSVLNGLIQDGMTPGPLVKTGAGTLQITNTNTYTQGTVIDTGTIQISGVSNLGTGGVELSGGNLELLSGTGINFNNPVVLNGPGTVIVDSGVSWTFNGVVSDGLNPGTLIKQGPGTLALAAVNTYSNGTNILGGILSVSDDVNLGAAAGPLAINNATLQLAGGVGETSARVVTLTNNASIQVDSGFDWTFSNQIQGAGKLIKKGAGLLTLSGANTYSLGTQIEDGTLAVSSASNLGTGGLAFNGTSSILKVSGTSTFSQPVSLLTQGEILLDAAAAWTFSNAISGTGPLLVNGNGLLSLTGNNTYSLGTYIDNSATLRIKDGNSVGSGTVHLVDGLLQLTTGTATLSNSIGLNTGSIELQSGANWTLNGTIFDDGVPAALVINGTGGSDKVTLGGNNTYSLGTSINNMTLAISSNANLGSGGFSFAGPSTLQTIATLSSAKAFHLLSNAIILTDAGTTATLSGSVDGVGTLEKKGLGLLDLTGTMSYTGNTLITEGSLAVNTNLSSSPLTTVGVGGVLMGTGLLSAVDIFGRISPGNSIGILTGSSFIFENGSFYDVEVIGTQADQIVSTGPISILSGATLNIISSNADLEQTYNIAHADGGITGTFSTVILPIRFQFNVIYQPNDILLNLTQIIPYANLLPPGNLRNIALCYDQMGPSDSVEAINAVLNTYDVPGLIAAFNQFDPGLYNGMNLAEQDVAENLLSFYTNHIQHYRTESLLCSDQCKRNNFWIAPFQQYSNQKKTGDLNAFSGYRNNNIGIASGFDFLIQRGLCITAGAAYSRSNMKWNNANAKADFSTYSALLATSWNVERFSLDAAIAYLYNDVKSQRNVSLIPAASTVDPVFYQIESKNYSNAFAIQLGSSYDLFVLPYCDSNFSIWPYVTLDYIDVCQQGFKEKNGGPLNLNIHHKQIDMIRPEVGIGFSAAKFVGAFRMFADVSLGYARESRMTGRITTANFIEVPGCSFGVDGLFPKNDLFIPTVDIGIGSPCNDLSLFFNYSGAYGSKYQESKLNLQFRIAF